MTNPRAGDRVTVYRDPNTRLDVEGIATLIRCYVDRGHGRGVWIIEFDNDPDMPVLRVIDRKSKLEKDN